MIKPALDLTKTCGERRYGDITVFFTWFGKDRTPCIVLTPTNLVGCAPIIPCIVPVTSAWAWAEETGDGRHCARVAYEFSQHLGFGKNIDKALEITSIIRDCMDDLLKIPPRPRELVTVADAIRTDRESGKEHHSEIKDDAS